MGYGNDPQELVVASNGSIAVAPTSETLPTTVSGALAAGFVDLGLVSEDGVSLSVASDVTEFRAWQSRQAVRRELNAQEIQASFALEQWNSGSIKLAFGGGAITEPSPGTFRYDFPTEDDALDERAMVVDWADGDKSYRLVLSRGSVTDAVETSLARASLSMLPITFKALEPDGGGVAAYLLSDDLAFGTGS